VGSSPSKPESPRRAVTKQSAEYGRGTHEIAPGEFELVESNELRDKLLSIFRSPTYRPPVLPSVAVELTDLTRKANASYDEVCMVLQKDPLIVASVLKLAQSPMYGARLPVQSLKEALQRLGVNQLRDMVWQVVTGMRLFRVKSYATIMEGLQVHSLFIAYMARHVAARAGIAAEHAFLCGLLHDVGVSGTLIALAESDKVAPKLRGLWDAIDGMHETAGGLMAKLWGLSPEIQKVVEFHHQLDLSDKPLSPLIPVLCVAEQLSEKCRCGLVDLLQGADGPSEPLDRHLPGRYEHALATLRLDAKQDELHKFGLELAERLGVPA
jgi:putative nucleotidyltransferase with HDIG domain